MFRSLLAIAPALFVICLIPALQSCQQRPEQNKLQQILELGVLQVGTRYGTSTFYLGSGGPVGFEYELARGFAEYLGVELAISPHYTLQEMLPLLSADQLDLIAAGVTITPKRHQQLAFGPAYQTISHELVFQQGKKRPRSLQDLTGVLTVAAGSSHAETLQQIKLQQSELTIRWRETDTQDEEELLQQVLSGEIDYTVANTNTLGIMRRLYPQLSVGFTLQEAQNIAWALNKNQDDSLRGALIEYFGEIAQNGKLAVLEDKYFGHVRQFNYVDTTAFLKAAETVLPRYQGMFEKYSNDIDWRLLAAMGYQESHWDPKAKSPTGVRGIMMLTLATAEELDVSSRLDPEQSIRGGATYLNKLIQRIPARIQAPDRLWFALAAYNIGLGHLHDARILTQRAGANPDLWIDVKQHLPLLRQKRFYQHTRYGYARGDEAVRYVANIRRYYDSLVYLTDGELPNFTYID